MRSMISGLFIASLVFCGNTSFAEDTVKENVEMPVEKAAINMEPAATMPKSCKEEKTKEACEPEKVMKEDGGAPENTIQKEMTPDK